MQQNLCFNCGGECILRNGRYVCAYCGSFMPEKISGEETSLLYNAFQRLRLAEFTDAEQDFDDIVRRYPHNAQAYWGRLMSRYGIKYEMDYDGKQIPTCYAASIDSIMDSSDYRSALEYADADTRAVFQAHAEYIERVRLEWTEKASREKPYDIFISYKDSDTASGFGRTADSDELRELYIYLMGKGYRVFFSRESLRGKAGEKYEPYIYGALSTARVMLVYGSKPEYINATWVKNEWSRYLKQIRAGTKCSDSLLVAYKGFSPKELPIALSETGRQHLDAGKPGFYNELVEAIERILSEHTPEETKALFEPQQASDLDIMRAKKKNGAPLISNVGVKGTSDPNDYWPNTPYTQVFSVDEYTYLRFHCVLMKGIGVQSTVKISYHIFDSQGSLVHERETEIACEPSYDRFSLFWTINPSDGVPAAPGKYTVLMWIEDSRAFEFTFRLTSAFDKEEHEKEEEQKKNALEDVRNNVIKQEEIKKEIADIKRKLEYPKLALWGIVHFVVSYIMLLVLVSATGTFGTVLSIAISIIYIVVFIIFFKKTRAVTQQGVFSSFFMVLSSFFYIYPAYLCFMAVITWIRRRSLTAKLSELNQMIN